MTKPLHRYFIMLDPGDEHPPDRRDHRMEKPYISYLTRAEAMKAAREKCIETKAPWGVGEYTVVFRVPVTVDNIPPMEYFTPESGTAVEMSGGDS